MSYTPKQFALRQSYAIAMQIPRCKTPEGKRRAILKWCEVTKKAIRGL